MRRWWRDLQLCIVIYVLAWCIIIIEACTEWLNREGERRKVDGTAIDRFLAELAAQKGFRLE